MRVIHIILKSIHTKLYRNTDEVLAWSTSIWYNYNIYCSSCLTKQIHEFCYLILLSIYFCCFQKWPSLKNVFFVYSFPSSLHLSLIIIFILIFFASMKKVYVENKNILCSVQLLHFFHVFCMCMLFLVTCYCYHLLCCPYFNKLLL